MDFHRGEQTADLAGLTRDITTKLVTTERLVHLQGDISAGATVVAYDPQLWSQLAASGLLGVELTESESTTSASAGGAGLTILDSVAVAEELGRVLAPVPFGPVVIAAIPAIAEFGTDDVKGEWLPALVSGDKLIAVALDEDLADDPLEPVTTATPDGDQWLLTGVKINVPYAESADAVVINAQGPDGVRVFIVETGTPGVTITATPSTGLTPSAAVELDGARVDPASALGSSGPAAVAFLRDRMTLALCAEQTGVLERALELTADYGREREQFGRAIGSFQAVAQRLADAYIDVRGLKLTTLQAAWLVSEHLDATKELATAKFWAADAGHRVAHTAVHVHGGVGIDVDHPLHRYFLRAKQNEFALGSASVQLRRIGAALAAEPA
jgi:acyl-CoA dehydrogenase